MFDKHQFVDDIKSAMQESEPQAAVYEVIERAIKTPQAIIDELGPPGSWSFRATLRGRGSDRHQRRVGFRNVGTSP